MEKFLKDLGVTSTGHYTKSDSYVIDIEDSNEYGKIFSLLDKNDDLEEQEDSSVLTIHNSSIIFTNDDYQLTLIADFDQDIYKLVCIEL